MMLNKIKKIIHAVGWKSLCAFALYQVKLRSGYFSLQKSSSIPTAFVPLALCAEQITLYVQTEQTLLEKIDLLRCGQFRPFSGTFSAPLNFKPPHPHLHWSKIKPDPQTDIKTIWEPARFGWAFDLVRGFLRTGEKVEKDTFFEFIRTFNESNPPYFGENWESAQECAMRMIVFSICGSLFYPHMNTAEKKTLADTIQIHAQRISVTLDYARSQRNNHLLSEAVGLIFASAVLPQHPSAERWDRIGRRELFKGLRDQIFADGSYIQHSVNYHRLMLQLVLCAEIIFCQDQSPWPENVLIKIQKSIHWLCAHCDLTNGQAFNVGHNDGANILPIGGSYADFRPTLYALSIRFLPQPVLPNGAWAELTAWFPHRSNLPLQKPANPTIANHAVLRLTAPHSTALLRCAAFRTRPAHADQLQVCIQNADGNILIDCGTYSYNLPKPWNNALKSARFHNAPIINGEEPMTDAGKFLWLDWDQGRILKNEADFVEAESFGYQRNGFARMRAINTTTNGWLIADTLRRHSKRLNGKVDQVSTHWVLSDREYTCAKDGDSWVIETATIVFRVQADAICVLRAGKMQLCSEPKYFNYELKTPEVFGWVSPTYLEKEAALSIIAKSNWESEMVAKRIQTEFTIRPKQI